MKTTKPYPSIFAFQFSLFVVFSLLSQPLCSQNLDSLYGVWRNVNQSDSNRVEAARKIYSAKFAHSHPDSALALAEELVTLGKNRGYKQAEAVGNNIKGRINQKAGNYDEAIQYYQLALKLYRETKYQKGAATALNHIGSVYYLQGDYIKGLNLAKQGLAIRQAINYKSGIAGSLNSIGAMYGKLGNYAKAIEYLERCASVYNEMNDDEGQAIVLYNLGNIYGLQNEHSKALTYYERALKIVESKGKHILVASALGNIGMIYYHLGDFDKSLEYLKTSTELFEGIGDKASIALSIGNQAEVYREKGDFQAALEHFSKSMSISTEIDYKSGLASASIGTGLTHLKTFDFPAAIEYCSNGLSQSESINELELQKAACQCLYDAYKANKDGNNALVYLEKLNSINDSLSSEETSKKLQQMEFAKEVYQDSVETFEKERQIELAHQEEVRKKDRTRNISFGVGALVLLLAGGLYSRLRYIRKSKASLQVEKDRSDNLLLNILPEEIAQELKEKGKADARDFEMVSILFTDFKGFTEQSAKLSAADLVHEINHCFEAFDGIIERYNIEKIKTIGDAYMAAGGLPVPTDDSVKNTVLAALEMQAFITQRKAEMDAAGKPAFEMRVGIHTGPVVAGIVGVKKFQYDIWGDTVNTASRIESNGEAGKVNISQATYELLKDTSTALGATHQFEFESRGKIEAKGKGEIEMYFVSSPINNQPS